MSSGGPEPPERAGSLTGTRPGTARPPRPGPLNPGARPGRRRSLSATPRTPAARAGMMGGVTSSTQIVLVGPAATGKTTLGALVAAQLGLAFVDIDEIGDDYYAEVGWSIDRLVDRIAVVGRVAAEREWEPARAHAVVRTLEDHHGSVIALGAGHTSYTDAAHLRTVRAALAPVRDVVLVLPSLDRDEALPELRRRSVASKGTDWVSDGHDFLAEWLDDPGTRSLARTTHVTGDASPEESARLLVAALGTRATGALLRAPGRTTT